MQENCYISRLVLLYCYNFFLHKILLLQENSLMTGPVATQMSNLTK